MDILTMQFSVLAMGGKLVKRAGCRRMLCIIRSCHILVYTWVSVIFHPLDKEEGRKYTFSVPIPTLTIYT